MATYTRIDLPAWRGLAGGAVQVDETLSPGARRWLVANDAAFLDAAPAAVAQVYPEWQEDYDFTGEEREELTPDIATPRDLLALLSEPKLHAVDVKGGDVPYLGIEAECSWDIEHGLGVMMHGMRAIEIGDAESSFNPSSAKHDALERAT